MLGNVTTTDMPDNIKKMFEFLTSKILILERENDEIRNLITESTLNRDKQSKTLKHLDSRIIQTEQYSRRECIIISGIPDKIPQRGLEETVLHVLRSIGLRVCSYDISACHRLQKNPTDRYPAKTIVRFINRKHADFSIRFRDRLIDQKQYLRMNLRIFECLCPKNEIILNQCKDLKLNNKIHDYIIRNGSIKIIRKAGDTPEKIRHPDDIQDEFKDFFMSNNW